MTGVRVTRREEATTSPVTGSEHVGVDVKASEEMRGLTMRTASHRTGLSLNKLTSPVFTSYIPPIKSILPESISALIAGFLRISPLEQGEGVLGPHVPV